MPAKIKLTTPLTEPVVEKLRSGQKVLLSGILYTARDAAHRKMIELLDAGQSLPVDLKGQILYYAGPSPARPGQVIGSAGPTTSGRMDAYTPKLLAQGLKGMIGKGKRSPEVVQAIRQYNAVYFTAVSGVAALIARSIKACTVAAFPELGQEAIHRLVVEEFPVIVVNNANGGDLYQEGVRMYMNRWSGFNKLL